MKKKKELINNENETKEKSNTKIYKYIFGLASIGVIGIAIYSYTQNEILFWFSSSLFIALASYLVGSLIGFLFGIPKLNSNFSTTSEKEYIANTSLEQIADWLTKIIIGLGLTQLIIIPDKLKNFAEQIVAGIYCENNCNTENTTFVISLLLFYLILGFFFAYFFARLELRKRFVDAETYYEEKEKKENLEVKLEHKINNEKELLKDKKMLRKILSSYQKDILKQLLKSNNKVYKAPNKIPLFKEFIELEDLVKLGILKKLPNETYELGEEYKDITIEELE